TPLVARLSSGRSADVLSSAQLCGSMPSTKRFGSKPGVETNASSAPLDGSIATSAPRRSPNAFSTTCCSLRSRGSRTLLPVFEAAAVCGELRHFLVREPIADRQALRVARLGEELLEARAVARLDIDQLGELVDHPVDVPDLARRDLERIGRVVARHHHAVAV